MSDETDVPDTLIAALRDFAQQNNLAATKPTGDASRQEFTIFTPAWFNYVVEVLFHVSRVPSDEPADLDDAIIDVSVKKQLVDQNAPLPQALLELTYNDTTRQGFINCGIPVESQSETDTRLLAHISNALRTKFPRLFPTK